MRYLFASLLVLTAPLLTPAQEPTLQEARQRLLRGDYGQAQKMYEKLAGDAKQRAVATLGRSRALQSEGEYDKALAVVEAALKDLPKNADLNAARAEVLYLRGRWEEALKAAEQALAAKDDQFLARFVRAQVYRDRGDLDKADEEFRWFVRTYTARSDAGNDIKDSEELILVGLAGLEYAQRHKLTDQFQFILKEVFLYVAKEDKDFWPADYRAGLFYQEKYYHNNALKAFTRALKINPQAAEVYTAQGKDALRTFKLKEAEHFADRALGINPQLVEALCLRADLHFSAGEMAQAVKVLERARKVNPRDEEVLGRLAACAYLGQKDADFQTLVKEVEKYDKVPGVFYQVLATKLDEKRRFDDAEKFFKKAVQLRPNRASAQAALGLLYMRTAKEKEARELLEKVWKGDKFHKQVFNTLEVLDQLDQYQTLKTKHFLLRYDPKHDQVLANFMGKYLEEIYAEFAQKFQFEPKGPILIELFNAHPFFSARVTTWPDLHTIGATTGRVIAMVSPRDKSKIIGRPFNWVRVLRHELVHVFNLEQTNFLVPHWFTEGLAVTNEGSAPPLEWKNLLKARVQEKKLMSLDDIHLSFIRPANQDEWHTAYLLSQLYVEYLNKTYGQAAIAGLLNAYRDGLDTAAAIQKVCKVDKATFEKGYRAYLEDLVKEITGKAARKMLSFKQAQDAHKQNPNDADVTAQLAYHLFNLSEYDEARKLVDPLLERKPVPALACYVKARLLLGEGKKDKALLLLESAVDEKTPELAVLRLLGKLQYEGKKFAEAAKTYELARKVEPYEKRWLLELKKSYQQAGNNAKLLDVLKEWVLADVDDLESCRQLAKLLLKAGQHAEAERFARRALEIDVLDTEAQGVLEEALTAQNKQDDLKTLRQLLGK
jgi:tetratricopeptide (TPR) repeat protein